MARSGKLEARGVSWEGTMGGVPQNISAPLLLLPTEIESIFDTAEIARTLSHSSFVEVGFIPC